MPPADELRRLVYIHGGRYQQYYTKRTVTHIIATNLPNSKIQELRYICIVKISQLLIRSKTINWMNFFDYHHCFSEKTHSEITDSRAFRQTEQSLTFII